MDLGSRFARASALRFRREHDHLSVRIQLQLKHSDHLYHPTGMVGQRFGRPSLTVDLCEYGCQYIQLMRKQGDVSELRVLPKRHRGRRPRCRHDAAALRRRFARPYASRNSCSSR